MQEDLECQCIAREAVYQIRRRICARRIGHYPIYEALCPPPVLHFCDTTRRQRAAGYSRPCFAGQNLSATTATPVPPFATGISNTSRTPSRLRAASSSKLLTLAPNTGGCATATFIPGRSRSKPNFSEPSHFGLPPSRRTCFPTSRNSERHGPGRARRRQSPISRMYKRRRRIEVQQCDYAA
jgi:hypothetical protein